MNEVNMNSVLIVLKVRVMRTTKDCAKRVPLAEIDPVDTDRHVLIIQELNGHP